MANTHTFKLTSGIECEVRELTGKHQRILTEQKNKKMGENLNEVIVDILVRVGTKQGSSINIPFVKSLLAADRKTILTQCRQFTMDFDPVFKFNYAYTTLAQAKGNHELEIDLSDNFPCKPLMKLDKETGEMSEAAYTEVEEIERHVFTVLPRSQKKIRWTLLDGVGEERGLATDKASRSSHTALQMRNPVELVAGEHDDIPVQLDLDKTSIKDIEFLRSQIKAVEGSVDTEISFAHPEADTKPKNEKEVIIDVLSVLAFFFPSEAI